MGSCPPVLTRTQRGLAMGLGRHIFEGYHLLQGGVEVVWRSQKQGSFPHVKRQQCGLAKGSAYSQKVPEMPRVCPKGTWSQTCFPDPPADWPSSCSWMRRPRAEAWARMARSEDLNFIWNH